MFGLSTGEINVTQAAADYFSHLLAESGTAAGGGVRLSVRSGRGCGGSEYDLQLVAGPQEGDEILTVNESLRVFIPGVDVLKLFGTKVDYRTDSLGNTRVIIENPNETGRCGCGESVTF